MQLADRLAEKVGHLDVEKASIYEGLTHKPEVHDGGTPSYQEEDAQKFQELSDRVIEALCEKYRVTPKELKRYKSKVASGKFSAMIPYSTYDSMGTSPRTLVKPVE